MAVRTEPSESEGLRLRRPREEKLNKINARARKHYPVRQGEILRVTIYREIEI